MTAVIIIFSIYRCCREWTANSYSYTIRIRDKTWRKRQVVLPKEYSQCWEAWPDKILNYDYVVIKRLRRRDKHCIPSGWVRDTRICTSWSVSWRGEKELDSGEGTAVWGKIKMCSSRQKSCLWIPVYFPASVFNSFHVDSTGNERKTGHTSREWCCLKEKGTQETKKVESIIEFANWKGKR